MTLTQQSTRRLRRRHRIAAGALAGGLAMSVLAGCAGSSGSADTSAESDTAAAPAVGAAEPYSGAADSRPGAADAQQSGREGSVAGSDKSTAAGIGVVALQQRRQIRTGQISVQVRDVEVAVSSARSFATAAQGFVSEEKTSTRPVDEAPEAREGDRGGPTSPTNVPSVVVDQSVLTLRVPQQSLDQVMGQVGGLGVVRSRSQSSQDVTDSYVDTTSRVKSQRASVDRVRTLLSRATGIGDVVRLESELSRREADLDALEARLAALDDSTTLATLVVTFSRPGADEPAPQTRDGFVGGLADGWQALVASTAVVLQIVGALVPFAVVLALVGLPVWLVLRRRRAGPPTPSDAPAPTA
jgi:Domain of unknown function (DUF4349)